ncbi:MAG: hypothetical protein ACE5I1_21150 [bacterium]
MIGFTAIAEHERISLNDDELEDARWFTREEYKTDLDAGRVKLPSQASIARRLIEEWLFAT